MGNYLYGWLIHTCLTISVSLQSVVNHSKGRHAEGLHIQPLQQEVQKGFHYYSAVSFRPMKETNDKENYAEILVPGSQQQISCGE